MTLIDMGFLCLMALSSMWVFDFIVYTLKSAPKSSRWGSLLWLAGAVFLALGIGHFTLGGVPL